MRARQKDHHQICNVFLIPFHLTQSTHHMLCSDQPFWMSVCCSHPTQQTVHYRKTWHRLKPPHQLHQRSRMEFFVIEAGAWNSLECLLAPRKICPVEYFRVQLLFHTLLSNRAFGSDSSRRSTGISLKFKNSFRCNLITPFCERWAAHGKCGVCGWCFCWSQKQSRPRGRHSIVCTWSYASIFSSMIYRVYT